MKQGSIMESRNMTAGNPTGLLLGFSLPLMAGNVFQQLYTFVDTMIVGIRIGYEYLVVLSAFFPLLYILYIMRACLQGMGNPVLPMVSSIAQLVMRVGCAFLLTRMIGSRGVFWGEILAWTGADLLLAAGCFYWTRVRTDKK